MVPERIDQSWRYRAGSIAASNRNRESIWGVFNARTRNTINNPSDHPIENYEFAGFYMALLTLPRYSFQFQLYDGNDNPIGYDMDTATLRLPQESTREPRPAILSTDLFRNIVLVRGSNTNYFTGFTLGTVVRFGTFTSFSRELRVAVNYARPSFRATSDGEPTIILITETPITSNPEAYPAYARPICDLSLFPTQNEYLIDPLTRFLIVDIVETDELVIVRKRKLRAKVYKLSYLDRVEDSWKEKGIDWMKRNTPFG